MNYNVELLLLSIVGVVAIITFMVSLRIRHKQHRQQEAWREMQRQAEMNINVQDEIISVRSIPLSESSGSSDFKSTKRAVPKLSNNLRVSNRSSTGSTNFVESSEKTKEEKNSSATEETEKTTNSYSDLIVIYVAAKPGEQFLGYDLLQSLLAAGFRFGDRAIFHRHEKANGEGEKLFSLASANEPGTFDINNMGAFNCKGLCLFMQLSHELHNEKALDLMLRAADQLAEDLDAQLLGANRLPLSGEIISNYRQWVREHMTSIYA